MEGINLDWISSHSRGFLAREGQDGRLPVPFYADLLSATNRLVDFRVPEGFRVSLERDVSSVLKKGLTVGFTPTRMASINVAWSQPTRSLSLGRYWVDSGLLEAVHLHRCHASPWLFSLATCIGKHPVFDARGCASLGRRSPSSSVNWTFESRGSIFGAQYLRRLFTHCLVGGELYYTATESSGGLSLAVQCRLLDGPKSQQSREPVAPMVGTCMINPIMGHLQISLVSPLDLGNRLQAAALYDLNVHSFDSDLALGLTYQPGSTNGVRSDEVCLGTSWRHGMGLSVAARVSDRLKVRLGLSTGPIWYRPSGIECLPTPRRSWRSSSPAIGLELVYDSST